MSPRLIFHKTTCLIFGPRTPSIIDTNAFANRHQITGPVPGVHPRPAKFLPPHKKPHFDENGPPNTLFAGFGKFEHHNQR